MPTVQTYRRPIRKLVIVTVAGLFLVHASPQASAQEATAVLLRIARSLTTGSVPRPRFARLGPGRRSRRRSRTLANRHGSGSPMASLKVRQPQRGPRETAPRSTLLEPAQRLRGRVVVDAEVPGDGRDADALIPHLGRLGGDPLVHRDGDTSTQLNLNRDFGQGAKPLRTCRRRRPSGKALTEPCDHGVEAAALAGDGVGLDAAAAALRPVAGGEDGGQVPPPRTPASARGRGLKRPAGSRRGSGPSVPRGRAGLAGEAGPEAHRGHCRRGARRRPALVVELGEVGREGLVVEPVAVEQASSRLRAPEYARRVFGEMEAAARRRAVGVGRSSSAAAVRVGARESITTAAVRSTCRRSRRPGPRSGRCRARAAGPA